jgi:hypothetical protein
MLRHERLNNLKPEEFKRAVGVNHKTFKLMIKLLNQAHEEKMKNGGRPCILSVEDQLIMSLKYLRDYPTHLKLGLEFGVSESASSRICRWVEDVLIKSKEFALPGKSKLLTSNYQFVLIDVTETPIERPKKKLEMEKR